MSSPTPCRDASAKMPSSCPFGSRSISSGSMPPTRSAPLRTAASSNSRTPGQRITPLWGKATICTVIRSRWRSRAASTPSSLARPLSRSMSTWVRRWVVPRTTHSRIRFAARFSVDSGKWGRIVLSVSMRLIRVGPAAWPIHGKPVSVLSRCMWPSTSPGKTRSPPMSSAGALFEDAAAPSPTTANFPPAMPISTRRPSAMRQLVRNASTLLMPRSHEVFAFAACYAFWSLAPTARSCRRGRQEIAMRAVIPAPVPGLDLGREYGHHQSPAIRAGGLIFCSGMVAINPDTGEREHGTVTSEARRIFENLKLLLESAGSSLDRVVQVHAMLYDRIEYDVLNRVYRQYVPHAPPARTVMSVQIEAGFKVMLDVTAAA